MLVMEEQMTEWMTWKIQMAEMSYLHHCLSQMKLWTKRLGAKLKWLRWVTHPTVHPQLIVHLIIVINLFQMPLERENHFVRSMKDNSKTIVMLRIVKIRRLMELKLVRSIAMTGIKINSLDQSQSWLGYDKC